MLKTVTDYLDMAEKKYTDKTAIIDADGKLTFNEFMCASKILATKIISEKLYKAPILLYLGQNRKCLVGMFGVMYSGNFYSVIDVNMPLARVKKICNVLNPVLIISDDDHIETIKDIGVEVINLDKVIKVSTLDENLINECRKKIVDTDLAYVLFTSGSTGVPKGVTISHRSVISYMQWSTEAFGYDDNTIIGNQTPFYFSMSVLDIYQCVCNAATLVIIPKNLFSFPVSLIDYLYENKVNTIYWVPSALCQVANLGGLQYDKLKCITKVLFAGEVMPTKQLNMWRRTLPNALFANLFGPTEVTDICTYYILDRELRDDEAVPIGNVCDNMEIFVIGEDGKTVSKGEEGELYVRGSTLSYGYISEEKKTKDVFVQNPLHNLYDEKVYRTGDLVYVNEYDELIFIGRKDFQIKHMGYRIELGEIENVVSSLDSVYRVCCVYNNVNSHIVMYYVGDIEKGELKKKIKNLVPRYMIPNELYCVKDMPLNANGKIDRLALNKNIDSLKE